MEPCRCACHKDWRFWLAPPPTTDPVEALAACDLCELLHRGTWTIYRKPRVVNRWKDPEEPK